jgi:hypothetical protein
VNVPFILVVCLSGVCCLTPLTVYLFGLALVNRRERSTIISGPWDFAWLISGLSGFILFGGGLVLSLLQSNFRYWMRGNFEAFRGAWASEKSSWLFLAAIYVLIVLLAVVLTLILRRRSLVIYNVEPSELEHTLAQAFERLGKPLERKGNAWMCGEPVFELDRFEQGRTATLRWLSNDRVLFQEIERLLRESSTGLAPDENPAARWIMSCAGGTGLWVAGCAVLLLIYVFSLK